MKSKHYKTVREVLSSINIILNGYKCKGFYPSEYSTLKEARDKILELRKENNDLKNYLETK